MDDELLSLERVASILGVSLSSVDGWIKEHALASFKRGSVRRVASSALAQFVAQNTLNPQKPDWLTPAVENKFREQETARLRQLVRLEVQAVLADGHRESQLARREAA